MISNHDVMGLKHSFHGMSIGITGRESQIYEAGGNDIGYTSKNRSIYLGFHHEYLEPLNRNDHIAAITGVFAHEIMHQVLTDFDCEAVYLSKNFESESEKHIFHMLSNAMEDNYIENYAPAFLGKKLVRALSFMRALVYKLSAKVDKAEDAFGQYFAAVIHYGDGGMVKGHFTDETAKQCFIDTLPIIEEHLKERDPARRIELVRQVFDITEVLWKPIVEMEEFMSKIAEMMKNAGRNGESNDLPQLGDGSPSKANNAEDPGEGSSKSKKRAKTVKIFVKSSGGESGEKDEDDSESGTPGKSGKASEKEEGSKDKKSSKKGSAASGDKSEDDKSEKEDPASGGKGKSGDEKDAENGDSANGGSDDKSNDGSGKSGSESADAKTDENKAPNSGKNGSDSEGVSGSNAPSYSGAEKEADANAETAYEESRLSEEELLEMVESLESAIKDAVKEQTKDDPDNLDIGSNGYKNSCAGRSVKNVKIDVEKSGEVTARYNAVVKQMSGGIEHVASALKRIFRNDISEKIYKTSGSISVERLSGSRKTARVFTKRRGPQGKKDLHVMIAVDESGSMSGSKIRAAQAATIALAEVFNKVDTKLSIVGFSADEGSWDVVHRHYMNGRNTLDDRIKLLNINAHCDNFDGYTIRYCGKYLQKQKETYKLLIVISDGQPACFAYKSRENGVMDTKLAIKEASKYAKVVGILLGDVNPSIHREMYGLNFLHIKDIQELFNGIARVIKQAVKEW